MLFLYKQTRYSHLTDQNKQVKKKTSIPEGSVRHLFKVEADVLFVCDLACRVLACGYGTSKTGRQQKTGSCIWFAVSVFTAQVCDTGKMSARNNQWSST